MHIINSQSKNTSDRSGSHCVYAQLNNACLAPAVTSGGRQRNWQPLLQVSFRGQYLCTTMHICRRDTSTDPVTVLPASTMALPLTTFTMVWESMSRRIHLFNVLHHLCQTDLPSLPTMRCGTTAETRVARSLGQWMPTMLRLGRRTIKTCRCQESVSQLLRSREVGMEPIPPRGYRRELSQLLRNVGNW